MSLIRAVIVEDEPLGRELLETKLRDNCPQVEIVGSFATAAKAMQGIQSLKPNLVFMDIGLDTITGLEIYQRLRHLNFEAIFITTSRELPDPIHALRLGASDYLSKPYTDEELIEAVERATPKILQRISHLHLVNSGKEYFIPIADLLYCKAAGNYTEVYAQRHNGVQFVLVSETLGRIEERLPPDRFFRIHRSALVHREYIRGINRQDGGLRAMMSDGQELDISRDKRSDFFHWMGVHED